MYLLSGSWLAFHAAAILPNMSECAHWRLLWPVLATSLASCLTFRTLMICTPPYLFKQHLDYLHFPLHVCSLLCIPGYYSCFCVCLVSWFPDTSPKFQAFTPVNLTYPHNIKWSIFAVMGIHCYHPFRYVFLVTHLLSCLPFFISFYFLTPDYNEYKCQTNAFFSISSKSNVIFFTSTLRSWVMIVFIPMVLSGQREVLFQSPWQQGDWKNIPLDLQCHR